MSSSSSSSSASYENEPRGSLGHLAIRGGRLVDITVPVMVSVPEVKFEPAVAEPEPVVAEPEPVVAEPEPAVAEPEPVVAEPEPAVAEPEPVVAEPGAGAAPTDPAIATATNIVKTKMDELMDAESAALGRVSEQPLSWWLTHDLAHVARLLPWAAPAAAAEPAPAAAMPSLVTLAMQVAEEILGVTKRPASPDLGDEGGEGNEGGHKAERKRHKAERKAERAERKAERAERKAERAERKAEWAGAGAGAVVRGASFVPPIAAPTVAVGRMKFHEPLPVTAAAITIGELLGATPTAPDRATQRAVTASPTSAFVTVVKKEQPMWTAAATKRT